MHSRSSPPKAVQEALANLPDSAWTPVERTPDYVISEAVIDIAGTMTIAHRKQYVADQLLQDLNRHEYDDSQTQRFGDGKVVGRIPLNVLFGHSEIATKLREGDRDHLKWWLNKDENRPFRSFKGRV